MRAGGRRVLLAVVLAALLAPAADAGAAPFTVTRFDDPVPDACAAGNCSLREAIRAANVTPGADSIALAAGTYELSLPGTAENNALDGDLDINDDLTLTGAGIGATAIDANGGVIGERALAVNEAAIPPPNPVVAISDLAITDGAGSFGAGLLLAGESAVTLDRVSLDHNLGTSFGAAAFNDDEATLTVRDSVVAANTLSGGFSAGFYNNNDARLVIQRTLISGNSSGGFAGALYANNAGTVTIEDSTFSGNSADGAGGAMYLQNDSTVTITDSTVSGNTTDDPDPSPSERGGGIYIQNDAVVTITDSTVSGNRAADEGGGISIRNQPTVRLSNATVAANTADTDGSGEGGGGISLDITGGSLRLANTIVAGNAGTSAPDCAGPDAIVSEGFNLIGNGQGCSFGAVAGDQLGSAVAPIDPLLGPLAANGGPTETMALLPGSPAIGAGKPLPFGSSPDACPPDDQRGVPRTGCDVGAYAFERCGGVLVNVVGTDAAEQLTGGSGRDGILGLGGNDVLSGKGGKDGLCGGAGKDKLKGGGGNDKLFGGGGNDRLACGSGRKDTGKGGGGKDKAKGCEKGRG